MVEQPLKWCWHSSAPNIWPSPSAINASGASMHKRRWACVKPGIRLQIIDDGTLHTILYMEQIGREKCVKLKENDNTETNWKRKSWKKASHSTDISTILRQQGIFNYQLYGKWVHLKSENSSYEHSHSRTRAKQK